MRKKKKLGEMLVERGSVSTASLELALDAQRGTTMLLGDLLLARGLVPKEELVATLKEVLRIEYGDIGTAKIDPSVLKLIPRGVALEHLALPLYRDGKRLVIVMANPQDLIGLDKLRFTSGCDLSPRFGFREEIIAAIESSYPSSPEDGTPKSSASSAAAKSGVAAAAAAPKVVRSSPELAHRLLSFDDDEPLFFETTKLGVPDATVEASELAAAKQNQSTPAIRITSSVIVRAIREKASDIHIDPQKSGAVIRIRVDGMLRDIMEVPSDLQASLISRIKILGDMDIAERRVPQDGRVLVRIGKNKIDLRVSTLPTQYGEKAVIRLLNPEVTKVSFVELGLSDETANSLGRILAQPQGMLLVTGPTGSGKTTTLYAALNQMRTRAKNIITVEDPVEYLLEGINQVQVNPKAGRNFAGCLRSILRQDPNVIMVGEIRDGETAEIALRSSQTGHMVLSTLHTNDSVAAVVRLLDLGIPPFLIASSVSAVIAQRLLRRLCDCHRKTDLASEFAALLLSAGIRDFGSQMHVPVGCSTCGNTGYKGRVGVFEILIVNDQIRAAIRSHSSPDDIRTMARGEGMKLIHEEAVDKAKAGVTSVEEIFRVVSFDSIPAAISCVACRRAVAPSYLFCPHCGADRRAGSSEDRPPTTPVETGAKV